MVDVITSFLFISIIILSGFFGQIIFKRTRVSDFILLLAIGLLAGPVLNIFDQATISFLRDITPFFASLALIIMLFEGGLHLNFQNVLREISRATLFTIMTFVITLLFVAAFFFVLGWPILVGLLVGAIIGGTCSTIIVPIVKKTTARDETKTMLALESTITDALCVIAAITIIQIIVSKSIDFQVVMQSILGAFAIAGFVGAVSGIAWLKILRDFNGSIKEYQYLLTIATLFAIYVVVEYAKGNGAVAALVFGMVLGNSKEIMGFLKMREIEIDANIKLFQSEIAFFVKTFFFIYLGIITDLNSFTVFSLLAAAFLVVLIGSARLIAAKVLIFLNRQLEADKTVIVSLMARGLAAAVLATYPLSIGVDVNGHAQEISQLVFLIIIFTNITTSAGVFYSHQSMPEQAAREEEKREKLVDKVVVGGTNGSAGPGKRPKTRRN
ncbi:MAG: cation:proton antiporter [Candidatus Diapherotrites archaeon]|nr:cation:proton antiporter [Candidatus Diapherotrites archaeon]